MAYVIAQPCIDHADQSCVSVCPVDCISSDPGVDRKFYIDPDACIDCGSCETACPNSAIFPADRLPAEWWTSPGSTPPGIGTRPRPARSSSPSSRLPDGQARAVVAYAAGGGGGGSGVGVGSGVGAPWPTRTMPVIRE